MDILILTKQTKPKEQERMINMSLFGNIVEEVKNFMIDLQDEIDMKNAEPLTNEEKARINSAYDWRCIGMEEE